MLQAANTDLFNPLVPKVHNAIVSKSTISFTKLASKSQLKLIGGFFFLAPSALMG